MKGRWKNAFFKRKIIKIKSKNYQFSFIHAFEFQIIFTLIGQTPSLEKKGIFSAEKNP